MRIANKNIDGIIKTLKELQSEGYDNIATLVTSNFNTRCYAFTPIQEKIEEIEKYGTITLNSWGVWHSKKNNLDFSKSVYSIYGIYKEARKRKNIK